ncbi:MULTISPECIES: AraC family transcriptional regulator [Bacillales]|uniref:AraC family transcriptional regulator n=1 Tax=Bacillales TaxID=1385 RepID=UPI0001788C0B|nr:MULTISPECIES: AraC family transcriptional regulator [Paenibacillus]ACX62775.1 transcriptional regulator, AraC family [Paenibacillus sp. Y412MC10]EGG31789.1 transcriptional regulator, AraC family [Paenibacillus sp. HGF5]ETT59927.1 AraC family transcriptional regulator [Paenibacillus sp. FSL H8-457]MCM3261065.1 AraC family transcriptional regulator [Paenibacillus lautus]
MTKPFRADYHDPTGYLSMEYDRRIGYFSMSADHLHDHYELYYLLSGERIYFIKDRSYRVRAGDLVFVDRNAVHKTLDSGRPDHDRLVLYINPELFADLAVPPELAEGLKEPFGWDVPILRLPSPASEAVERMVGDMVNEMIHPQAGSSWLLRHRTVELLLFAYRSRHLGMVRSADTEPVLHPKTQAVVRYLNDNYRQALTLPEVAEAFRISPHYLSRLFKQTTGFTFSDYLNLLRVKEAQRLLRESDDSITDIAWRSGFSNFSHFGKMFKRTVQLSPRAYRQQYRMRS